MNITGYKEVAAVKFFEGRNTKKVYYFAVYDGIVQEGDYALVRSKTGWGGFEYGVVKVEKIIPVPECEQKPTAEILSRLNLGGYLARVEMRKKRDVLMSQMRNLVKDDIEAYKVVAEKNDKMKDLLAEYNETLGV